ncbi:MAG: hypothetical protein AAB880_00575 [Patescibacteria group bacterium]
MIKKLFIAIIFILTPLPAFAGSTALAPSKIVASGEAGGVISKTVVVSNLSSTSQYYNFYPDEAADSKKISVIPSQFILGPGQTAEAVVRLRPGDESWRSNLSLVAYNASQIKSRFRVGDGIKIPVWFNAPQVLGQSVKITGVTAYFWLLTLFIASLALALLGVVFYLYYRHAFWRQIRARHRINFL